MSERKQCPHCDENFSRPYTLKRHIDRRHRAGNGLGSYECQTCSSTFSRKDLLTRHERIHNGKDNATCPVCSKPLSRKDYLPKHIDQCLQHLIRKAGNTDCIDRSSSPQPQLSALARRQPVRFQTEPYLCEGEEVTKTHIWSQGESSVSYRAHRPARFVPFEPCLMNGALRNLAEEVELAIIFHRDATLKTVIQQAYALGLSIQQLDIAFQCYTGRPAHRMLMQASKFGNINAVKTLLDAGIDIDCTSRNGQTALHHSCYQGFASIVEELIGRGANLNIQDHDGKTPLSTTVRKNNEYITEILLMAGANVNIPRQEEVWNPLWTALLLKFLDLAAILVEYNAGLDIRDLSETPLHVAADRGHVALTTALLRRGVDVNQVKYAGRTPYMLALKGGHHRVATLLVEYGASREDGWMFSHSQNF